MRRARENYQFLSQADWDRHRHDTPQELETINKFREKELKSKLKNCVLPAGTFGVDVLEPSRRTDELRIVIIGKTGQGKSATGNNLLNRKVFEEDCTAGSVTKESRMFTEKVDSRNVSVMDTPGLQDTNQSNEVIVRELNRITNIFHNGVHAFVYVMNMANPRFTAEDRQVLDLISKTFGGKDFLNYCMIVFTHGDSQLKDMNMERYRAKQLDIRGNMGAASISTNVEDYALFLDEILWRMVAVNNKATTEYEKNFYRNIIFNMIDRMRSINYPEVYTNEMFARAQNEKKKLEREGVLKGWDPSVMHIVEEMVNGYPEITREELQQRVRERYNRERDRGRRIEIEKREKEIERKFNERLEHMLMEQETRQRQIDREREREREERRLQETEMKRKLSQLEEERVNWEQQRREYEQQRRAETQKEREECRMKEMEMQMKLLRLEEERSTLEQMRLENEQRLEVERERQDRWRKEENARQERERKDWEKRFEEAERRAAKERSDLQQQAEKERRLANERLDRQVTDIKDSHTGLLEKGIRYVWNKFLGIFS